MKKVIKVYQLILDTINEIPKDTKLIEGKAITEILCLQKIRYHLDRMAFLVNQKHKNQKDANNS